jgi:hypothetical protein
MTTHPLFWNMDFASFRHHRALLAKTGSLACRVISDSMEPVLRVGEQMQIEPVGDLSSIKRFDIVVVHIGDRLLCHFVWHINRVGSRTTVSTRSLKDFLHNDIPMDLDNILGKVSNRKIPMHTRAKIIVQNFIRKSA